MAVQWKQDPFLRWGFRVAQQPARLALNRIAIDVRVAARMSRLHKLEQAAPFVWDSIPNKSKPYSAFGLGIGYVENHSASEVPAEMIPEKLAIFFDFGRGFSMSGGSQRVVSLPGFRRNAIWTGIGMGRAYRSWPTYIENQEGEANPHPGVDRGMGAMIWLGSGLDPVTAAAYVHSFPQSRHEQIWRGVGFSAAFTTELERHQVDLLMRSSGPAAVHFTRGAAFGMEQRRILGIVTSETERSCNLISGVGLDGFTHRFASDFGDWL
ncbi:hypothetical protein F183_A28110 [Bryobacterales bacterium F-183]|nr:hypothetical protein F183_A28110 [Bryobacterales bacterium F-183]